MTPKENPSEKLFIFSNTLLHKASGALAIILLWKIISDHTFNNNFAWHILLCTLAYVPLMAEAVILFGEENIWSKNLARDTKIFIHGVILFLSGISVSIGISLMIYEKREGSHFTTTHAKTGLASWILVLTSVIFGVFSANAQKLKFLTKPIYFKLLHNIVGVAAFGIGMLSLGYGIHLVHGWKERQGVIWLLGIVTVWSCTTPFLSMFNQIKTIIKSY